MMALEAAHEIRRLWFMPRAARNTSEFSLMSLGEEVNRVCEKPISTINIEDSDMF